MAAANWVVLAKMSSVLDQSFLSIHDSGSGLMVASKERQYFFYLALLALSLSGKVKQQLTGKKWLREAGTFLTMPLAAYTSSILMYDFPPSSPSQFRDIAILQDCPDDSE
jgi:hypothetical protein